MKPNFALSLSFEGIRLLHRAAGGWHLVGEVALDAADMAGELAVLRKTAAALEPGGFFTKLLLPNEQIKYLSIDTPGLDDGARHAAATEALEGATPYAVTDLAFDISAEGAATHIAAVARETLEEAESFAREHRFQPVSFAAVPGENPFFGEPFFGATRSAADWLPPDATVSPDDDVVVVIGDIPAPVSAEAPSDTASAEAATAGTDPTPPDAPVPPDNDLPSAMDGQGTAAVPPRQEDTPQDGSALTTATPAPALGPAQTGQANTAEPAPPTVGFASRRAPERRTAAPLVAERSPPPAPAKPAQAGVTSGRIEIEPDALPDNAAPEPAAKPAGFLSRRRSKSKKPDPKVIPTPPPPPETEPGTEKERMTIFGARKPEVGGKPRFLGLILTAALLVFLAGVAAWASVFLDDGLSLSRLFGDRNRTAEVQPELPEQIPKEAPDPTGVQVAALDPSLTEEDAAVLDALSEPAQPAEPPPLTEAQVQATYAASGIWPLAPDEPVTPALRNGNDDLYLTSIDPVSSAADAIALPDPAGFLTDVSLASVASPAAAGTRFALGPDGLVIPTAQGALSPDGYTVYLGPPPAVPPATLTRFETTPQDTAVRSALAALRPQPRPADLAEKTERAQLGGLTRRELAAFRPALRPRSLQQQAEAEAAPAPETLAPNTDGAVALALQEQPQAIENATKYAVRASIRPDGRPSNFSRIVKRAQRNTAKQQQEVRVASAAATAPRVVKPKIPSKASVARQATVKNAINLKKINLIGVYGKPSNRRALVRLGNGRYRKVVVGDRIDGGRVSAIGDSELRYTKRGRNLVLKMPR